MANFSPKDISVVNENEEGVLKQCIAEAWEIMRSTNWDVTHYCTFNPHAKLRYPVAKSFQAFFNNEGWSVVVKEDISTNFKFDIYWPDLIAV